MRKTKVDEEKKIISIDIELEDDVFDMLMNLRWQRCIDIDRFIHSALIDKTCAYNEDYLRRGYE